MFYKLFGLFAENARVNRDVILLCPVTGSQLFHELSDMVNQGGKFTVEEERWGWICWLTHLTWGAVGKSALSLAILGRGVRPRMATPMIP